MAKFPAQFEEYADAKICMHHFGNSSLLACLYDIITHNKYANEGKYVG